MGKKRSTATSGGCDELTDLLAPCPDEICDLVMALRQLVLTVEPRATERVMWKGISYHRAWQGGPVKGAICQITPQDDCVQLGFIHGAALPDPEHLLQGDRKAKRFVAIHSAADISKPAIKKLIQAAVRFKPT